MTPLARTSDSARQELWFALGFVILLPLSFIPYFISLTNHDPGDVPYYFDWGHNILRGLVPYRDFRLEYPPYALAWFIVPGLRATERGFQFVFALELLVLDAGIKLLLLREGRRWLRGWKSLVPVLAFAVAGIVQQWIYVKRFDLIPAAITFLAVVALSRNAVFASGLLLAIGTATKMYPMLVVPVFFVWLWRRKRVAPFIVGLGVGFIPLLVIGLRAPWWRFAAYHQERGLQVESVYASFIWLGHRLGATAASWDFGHGAYEVGGPAAAQVLPYAKVLMVATVAVSLAICMWRAYRDADEHPGAFARLALLPILAFVAFNYVLSPQYMIWLMGLVSLASLKRWSWPLFAICGAVGLTQLIFFDRSYVEGGLSLQFTLILCLRNTLLVCAWVGLAIELMGDEATRKRAWRDRCGPTRRRNDERGVVVDGESAIGRTE